MIRLRRFNSSDLDNLQMLEADDEVMRFTPMRKGLPREKSAERLQNNLNNEKAREPYGIWAAEFAETGEFFGWLMLLKQNAEPVELGFMIVRRYWGQGLTVKAAQLLIDYAFNDLGEPALKATTDEANLASKKVLAKLEFKKVRTQTNFDTVLQREVHLEVFELRSPTTENP